MDGGGAREAEFSVNNNIIIADRDPSFCMVARLSNKQSFPFVWNSTNQPSHFTMKILGSFLATLLLLSDDSWGWTPVSSRVVWTAQEKASMKVGEIRHQVPSGGATRFSSSSNKGNNHNLITRRTATITRHDSRLAAVPGADIEQPPVEEETGTTTPEAATADSTGALMTRGKKNEIDFTIAPADVSLSRAYGPITATQEATTLAKNEKPAPVTMSLTLALNNASNRAVRRIILARSWPSAEALNASLRQVAQAERRAEQEQQQQQQSKSSTAKCPVPRPILNVLTRKRRYNSETTGSGGGSPKPRSRTDEEYVADQLRAFRERYGSLPNYDQAEDYLAAVLSLATSGVESERAAGMMEGNGITNYHAYHNSYRRLLGVLRTVGVGFETDPKTKRRRIAKRLADKDICLSMLDRIQLQRDENVLEEEVMSKTSLDTEKTDKVEAANDSSTSNEKEQDDKPVDDNQADVNGAATSRPRRKLFRKDADNEAAAALTKDDLGGVLLSAEEPSMTRQLNVLSNIVLRALLFGGDQELLVLAETLDADRAAFVDRWYPGTGGPLHDADLQKEERPGVQYLNCLIDLLRDCYDTGIVVELQPSLPLSQSYANAYERLVATAVELGSGYLKPAPSSTQALPKPRSAKEELGRLALWESRFRQSGTPDISPYPEDLEGEWEVRDEVGGELIGSTRVSLGEGGEVEVKAPLEGLRWRLDPGPTHLDTCTFQVLNTDGTILQYRGFIDRGARLESRFSGRPLRIRGSVQFQMRDGSVDYYKDILPINYREGTTKFVMTKVTTNGDQ